jgi:DNA-binding CsgD family transcriptional regulator
MQRLDREQANLRAAQEWLHEQRDPEGWGLRLAVALWRFWLLRTELSAGGDGEQISAREREVAALVARGLTNRQIADALVIAKSTVDRHIVNILRKLAMENRAQVAVWAAEHGVLEAAPSGDGTGR